LWRGDPEPPTATINCELGLTHRGKPESVAYELRFSERARTLIIIREQLARLVGKSRKPQPFLTRSENEMWMSPERGKIEKMTASSGASILSQFKSPADRTPTTEVGNLLSQIRIFREFRTGLGSQARDGVSTSVPNGALVDGGDNLALVLHDLDFLGVRERIKDYLQRFCERYEDWKVRVGQGLARIFLREKGLAEPLSGARLSDGTLKLLAILAVLFHPKMPPVLCIEEPELGLHPDALQLVAEALVEASHATQVIVTTHSDALVDAFTERPENVLVCERDFDNGTQMKRLSKRRLKEWLEHYSLGQLWRIGEIGGGRR
jgi:predicted ATPase